ncbi:MAG: hypothetical protein LBG87_03115 [Spirochaetaceae bacterium]|jgi:hypothetical protein|nr:hypothetical protein [Spirochaetaceae bacterium]
MMCDVRCAMCDVRCASKRRESDVRPRAKAERKNVPNTVMLSLSINILLEITIEHPIYPVKPFA